MSVLSVHDALRDVGDRVGWDDDTRLAVTLRFLEHRAEGSAFRDFLEALADDEARWAVAAPPGEATSREAEDA